MSLLSQASDARAGSRRNGKPAFRRFTRKTSLVYEALFQDPGFIARMRCVGMFDDDGKRITTDTTG
jgi:hypothetical protein